MDGRLFKWLYSFLKSISARSDLRGDVRLRRGEEKVKNSKTCGLPLVRDSKSRSRLTEHVKTYESQRTLSKEI